MLLYFLARYYLCDNEQGRIHGYQSRVWMGRSCDKKQANSSIWAGAVVQKPPVKAVKAYGDQQTDRPADTSGHRVTCTQLKMASLSTPDAPQAKSGVGG